MKTPRITMHEGLFWLAVLVSLPGSASGQSDADSLAKQLSNPVASLISVPLQANIDYGGGINDDAERFTLNVQPVVPISISNDWNLVLRTIVPIRYQSDAVSVNGDTSQSGLGDTVQSFFFSPKEPTDGGVIWGVGPVFLYPTASDEALGADKWGAGPTGVVLVQRDAWTFGALANHIWDVTGKDNGVEINATFLQPFVSYGAGGGVTYTVNLESTYDWESDQWSAPVNALYTKVTQWGSQLVSVGGGLRWYADGPENGPDWGARFVVTLLYPK